MMKFEQKMDVYLHREPVDFRKQINGLGTLVQEGLGLDIFSESCFVFGNRQRNRIKILYWQRNGFCLWMKRLEKDTFSWPKHLNKEVISLTTEELQWLLDGFDIWRKPPHKVLNYTSV